MPQLYSNSEGKDRLDRGHSIWESKAQICMLICTILLFMSSNITSADKQSESACKFGCLLCQICKGP